MAPKSVTSGITTSDTRYLCSSLASSRIISSSWIEKYNNVTYYTTDKKSYLLAQLVKYDVHTTRKIKIDTRYFFITYYLFIYLFI